MSQEEIIDKYMDTVQDMGAVPHSIYTFCQASGIDQDDFYKEFDSLKSIDKSIYLLFFLQTNKLLEQIGSFSSYGPKEKLLNFYFTFFEVLAANRPYVLVTFPSEIKEIGRLEVLSDLRKSFLSFAAEVFQKRINSDIPPLEKIKALAYEEGTYAQLLFMIGFWIRDNSDGFEKTDILIEKSLKATFDIIDIPALKSVLDLGKFLLKEVKH
jgi:hypothetical protein